MSSTPTRSPERRWLRWGRVLFFGVMLGALQFLVFLQAKALDQWSAAAWTATALATLLSLLIPLLEGFLTARQSAHPARGMGTGCLVGSIGFLVVAVSIALSVALTPPPIPCSNCVHGLAGAGIAAAARSLFGQFIFGVLVLEGVGGVVGGLMGGGIGGILGERRTRLGPEL